MATDSHALTTSTGETSPVAGLSHDARGGISNVVLGMLLFITSEVMFFGGLFAAYFNVRANAPQWPTNAASRNCQGIAVSTPQPSTAPNAAVAPRWVRRRSAARVRWDR